MAIGKGESYLILVKVKVFLLHLYLKSKILLAALAIKIASVKESSVMTKCVPIALKKLEVKTEWLTMSKKFPATFSSSLSEAGKCWKPDFILNIRGSQKRQNVETLINIS